MNAPSAATQSNGSHEAPLLALLQRMDRRLERVEEALSRLDGLTRGAPAVVATVTDSLDAFAGRLAEKGIDVDQRARVVVEVAEKLTSPSVVRALAMLTDRADAIERIVRVVEQAPALMATVVDVVDSVTARLDTAGIDVDERVRVMLRLLERLTAPQTWAALEKVLDSGLLDAGALDSLGRVAEALASTGAMSPPPVGAWGAFRALGDPDIQRAVGLLLAIAKQLGRSLATPRTRTQLPPAAEGG
jgi:hypothetical protein